MKKGFTLVELLAILVIIAVIALIGTPIINNVIKNTKTEALVVSARNILNAAKIDYEQAQINRTEHSAISDLAYKGTHYDDIYINYSDVDTMSIALYSDGICVYGPREDMKTADVSSASDCYDLIKYTIVTNVNDALNYQGTNYLAYNGTDGITNSSTTPTTTPQTGDILICGQYEYRYKQYYSEGTWYSNNLNGWGMALTSGAFDDTTVNTKMLSKINGKNIIIMDFIFYRSKAVSIDLSSFDTSNVISMNGMFYNCEALTSIDVTHFDTSKVTSMRAMFCYCSALTNLDVTHFDTSNVTSMESMFACCYGLTSLDITYFDTSKVILMDCMFFYCYKLTNLDVTHFDTAKVTNMGGMFENCQALTSLNLTSFNTSLVTNMARMFWGCTLLTSITGTTSKWVIGTSTDVTSMFTSCGASSVTLVSA